ncbi:MAG: response regulator [Deltaproteobacteria bacterium]|nr:response regulator [Deltaproteobacteria bacterium]
MSASKTVGSVDAMELIDTVQRSNDKLRYALHAARMGLWEWDLLANSVIWSPETEAIFGVPEGQFKGTYEAYAAFIPPDWLDRINVKVTDFLNEASDVSEILYQHPIVRGDGVDTWVEVRGTLTKDAAGRAASMAGICADISDRIRQEQERQNLEVKLQHAQKMEAIGQLAGGVAHDFNNILTAILGNGDIAMSALDEHSPPRIAAALEQIVKSAQRAAALTRQLLAFSRRQVTQPRTVNLNKTIDDLEPMLHRLLPENITINRKSTSTLPSVFIDPTQVEQIVMNLAVNARDAMSNGGILTLYTGVATLDKTYADDHPEVLPGKYVMLSVSDSGKGMDKETLSRIYEPFFTTKELGLGTGLGLATVYGIVKQNNGHISVYSEPGSGTVFRVYFPFPPDTAKEDVPEIQHRTDLTGTETILVAEDDDLIRGLVETQLSSAGYNVITAANGEEANEKYAHHEGHIDLLLTDVIMPDMNGRVLADTLLEKQPNIKVLFISGYTANIIANHGVQDAGVAFLEKPFTLKMLLTKIKGLLNQGLQE